METRMMEATRTATSTVLVEKRDGRIVDFDAANIINAIKAAFTDLNKQVGPQRQDRGHPEPRRARADREPPV